MISYFIIALAVLIADCKAQEDVSALCRAAADTQSCSRCIQAHSQCAWCTDPAFTADFRCDLAKNFNNTCPPQYLYQDMSHARVTESVPAGTYESQVGKIRQIEPQVVHILARPGESVIFPLKYYHSETNEAREIQILNSASEASGVSLSYSVDCKGIHSRGDTCRNVRNSESVTFNVTVTVRDCNSNAVVSIGIGGVREVVAMYVRPQCGCDCEKPDQLERNSGHCGGEGTLSCGICQCDDPRKGGRRCECDLPNGVSTEQLEAQCRESPEKSACSGHGYCACGTCVCEQPHLYSGRYCECANKECPKVHGEQCNGHGSCSCGKCECHNGWSGHDCTCIPDKDACFADDGQLCSGHGSCTCNKCKCDSGFEGAKCERALETPTAATEPSEQEATAKAGESQESEEATPVQDSSHKESSDSSKTSDSHDHPKAEQAAETSTGVINKSCAKILLVTLFCFALIRNSLGF